MVKNYANKNDIKLITVPRIPNSILCSVTALSNLLALTPKGSNNPLFQVKVHQTWVPLTDTKVRCHLSLLLSKLKLGDTGYTFHTFRRSGATFVFNNNVALQNIQKHGTWTSDCVWRYITDTVDAGEQVAAMSKQNYLLCNYLYCWGLGEQVAFYNSFKVNIFSFTLYQLEFNFILAQGHLSIRHSYIFLL